MSHPGNTPLGTNSETLPGRSRERLCENRGAEPRFSYEDRVAVAMVDDTGKSAGFCAGDIIVEPTSGNTGLGLAFVAAARGYKLILVMPDSMSIERRNSPRPTAQSWNHSGSPGNARLHRPRETDPRGERRSFLYAAAVRKPGEPAAHRATTGPEIWEALGGKVDAIIATVGTGGTFSGIAQYLKKDRKHKVWAVAVEPAESPLITQARGKPLKPGLHKIQESARTSFQEPRHGTHRRSDRRQE